MLPRSSSGSGGSGLAAAAMLFLLLLFIVGDVPADAAVVANRAQRRSSSSSNALWSSSSSSPRSSAIVITSIARLRSVVSPSAANVPGCVLFLNATSAHAAGCASEPRRLRQDPPRALPLVGGLPEGGRGRNRNEQSIVALGAGDDAVALDLLLRPNSSELSSRGVAGLVALPGPPPEGDWSPDDANPQVRRGIWKRGSGALSSFRRSERERKNPKSKKKTQNFFF